MLIYIPTYSLQGREISMKKILIGLVIVGAIIAAGATLFLGKLDGLIADAIETEGTAAIGTSVTVDSVETKLADGVAIINGLAIANTSGYKAKHALIIDAFTAKVDYQTQIIEEIIISEPVINAELVGTRSNFDALLEGMPEEEENEEGVVEGDEVVEGEEELVLTINTLQVKQATVNIDSDKLGQTSFVMENLVLNDLSGTVDELSDQVTSKLVGHITSQIKAFANKQVETLLKAAAVLKAEEKLNEKATEKLGEKLGEKTGLKLKKFSFKRKKD